MRVAKMETKMAWALAAGTALCIMLGGCTEFTTVTRGDMRHYVAVAPQTDVLPPRLEGRVLQACVDHASAAERADRGIDGTNNEFLFLSFSRDNLRMAPLHKYIGKQYVGAVMSGQGTWQGYNDQGLPEYREISFNCLLGKTGPVATLVQSQ